MNSRMALVSGALVVLVGCGSDPALTEAQLLVPADVELSWNEAFNGVGDGRVALVPVDFMVYESANGDPLEAVDLEIRTSHPDAFVLLPDTVLPVDPEDCDDCVYLWDAWRDQYFELLLDDLPDDDLGAVRVLTDAWGLARVYIYVDAFPLDDEGFGPVPVQVISGSTEELFLVVPR